MSKKKKAPISPREFIKAWQTSETIDEVMEKTKMSRSSAYSRAFGYRKRGIPLKKLKPSDRFDWNGLSEYAELFLANSED